MANEQYELYQQGTAAALAERMLDLLDGKADTDGYYTMLTAGAADNLTARGDGVTASFLYRTTGGSASVPDDAEATVRSIKGRTLAWNQLVSTPYYSSNTTNAGTTATITSDNTVSISGTTETTGDNFYFLRPISLVAGHKYLVSGIKKMTYTASEEGGSAGVRIYDSTNTTTVGQTTEAGGFICTAAQSTSTAYLYYFATKAGITVDVVVKPMLFDLTAMFGAGNEPSTVAEFESLYPLPYYPYDAGTLLPVNMTGVETVGFNQLPELTYMAAATAKAWTFDKDKCVRLIPGNQYQLTFDVSGANNWRICYLCFDLSGNRITFPGSTLISACGLFTATSYSSMFYSASVEGFTEGNNSTNKATTFTPAVEFYILPVLSYGDMSASSTITNACVHLVWSGYRNGEYEPHWRSERAIPASTYFPDGMRSAGSVYDELRADAAVTRVYEIALDGTENWVKSTNEDSGLYKFYVDNKAPDHNDRDNIVCNRLVKARTELFADMDAGTFFVQASGRIGVCIDSTITSVDQLKAWLGNNNLHIFMPLNLPTVTPTATPFPQPINMDYRFADFGTERILVPTGQMSAPPNMNVVYGLNATDTLRTLPTEYVSKASDASFTAALGTFLNATITREWNETDQRYDYTITANGE